MSSLPNPFDIDWGGVFRTFWNTLWNMVFGNLRADIGAALRGISEMVATSPLANYYDPAWLRAYGILYAITAVLMFIGVIILGAHIAFSHRELPEDTRRRAVHPLRFILFATVMPLGLVVYTQFIDVFRQIFLAFNQTILSADWSQRYEGIGVGLTGIGFIDFILTYTLNGILNWIVTKEVQLILAAAYVFPFFILFGYAILHYWHKFGSKFLQFFTALFVGLTTSLPLLVIWYGIGALLAQISPWDGADIAIALFTAFAGAVIPIVLVIFFMVKYDFSKIMGGDVTVKGKTEAKLDPDSDKPLSVRIKDEIKTAAKAAYPILIPTDAAISKLAGMQPRITSPGQPSSGRLINDYGAEYDSAHQTPPSAAAPAASNSGSTHTYRSDRQDSNAHNGVADANTAVPGSDLTTVASGPALNGHHRE